MEMDKINSLQKVMQELQTENAELLKQLRLKELHIQRLEEFQHEKTVIDNSFDEDVEQDQFYFLEIDEPDDDKNILYSDSSNFRCKCMLIPQNYQNLEIIRKLLRSL
jgi:hypothetical protein